MKKPHIAVFFIVALLIAGMAWLALVGVDFCYGDISTFTVKGAPDIRTGIDIRGGIEVTFVPDTEKDTPVTRTQVDSIKKVLELRLDSNNITDYDVYADYANGSVLIRYPWKSDETNYDPEAAISELGAQANLTFRDASGNVLMNGDRVKKATAASDEDGFIVSLEFDAQGAKEFADITSNMVGETLCIYMDEDQVSSATVQEAITGGQARITGSFTKDDVISLADTINAGALPYALKASSTSSISPTLGKGALDVTVKAAIIGFILVCLFILLYYRVPGFVACIALVGQVAGAILAVSVPQFTLTLPGIAGIILSIGMGVDANIITAERIREEVRAGRTISGAINAGYENSWSAIFDGNITVLIVAVILYFLGSGSVKSFGFTLGAGVIFNFIMGVWASKWMQKGLSGFKFLNKPWLYGGKKNEEN